MCNVSFHLVAAFIYFTGINKTFSDHSFNLDFFCLNSFLSVLRFLLLEKTVSPKDLLVLSKLFRVANLPSTIKNVFFINFINVVYSELNNIFWMRHAFLIKSRFQVTHQSFIIISSFIYQTKLFQRKSITQLLKEKK